MYGVVSQNYSTFLKLISDYSNFLNNYKNYSNSLLEKVSDGSYIRETLKKELDDYPKFPISFKPITKMGKINQYKIYDIVPKLPENPSDLVEDDLLQFKSDLDNIPDSKEQITLQLYLQKIFIEDIISDAFERKKFLLGTIRNVENLDYFYEIIFNSSIDDLNNFEFPQQVENVFFLSRNVDKFTNFFNQFSDYYYSKNIITESKIENDIDSYFEDDELISELVDKFVTIILKTNYKLIEYSNSLKNTVSQVVEDSLNDFKNKLLESLNSEISSIRRNILAHNKELIVNKLIVECLIDQNNNGSFLADNYFRFWNSLRTEEKVKTEEEYIKYFLSRITPNNINKYMLLWYIYSTSSEKFINILPMITDRIVDDFVFKDIDKQYLTKSIVESFFKNYYKEIDFDKYTESINNVFSYNGFLNYSANDDIFKMVTFLSVFQKIDEFFESDSIDDYTQNLLKNIFDRLRKSGFFPYNYNWYQDSISINFFLKTYLKNEFLNNHFLENFSNSLKEEFQVFLDNDIPYQEDELLSDNLGSRNSFYAKYQFDEDSFEVYLDEEIVSQDDYTLNGDMKTITFDSPPSGSELRANYQPYYEIEFGTNEESVRNSFINTTSSETTVGMFVDFLNSFYKSTIKKQLYLNILNNYLVD
ncbi:MAG: hypothetical protein ACOC22_03360 [bacterium]